MEPHPFQKMDYKLGLCRRCGYPEAHDAHTTSEMVEKAEQIRIVRAILDRTNEVVEYEDGLSAAPLFLEQLIIDLEDGRVKL